MGAAGPVIRSDLHLSYLQVGMALTVPGLLASAVEPVFGVMGDAGRRRRLVLAGGAAFAIALLTLANATGFALLLAAQIVLFPASGAFVSLSQATLMDHGPGGHERGMARWVAAGSVGALAGPLAFAAFAAAGLGWRPLLVVLAAMSALVVWMGRTVPHDGGVDPLPLKLIARRAVRALRHGGVLRWLLLLELADLLGDVLTGFVALYLVDVGKASPAQAGLAVAVWTGAELLGSGLLVPLVTRIDGVHYLRASAGAALILYPAFLLAPSLVAKIVALGLLGLVRAGWYAVGTARLYRELPGASGSVVGLASLAGVVGQTFPVLIGAAASRFGLGAAMWLLLAAPVALFIGVPRVSASRTS
jgi:FSR family fosmidomycin resistance protein-like MFS transporter